MAQSKRKYAQIITISLLCINTPIQAASYPQTDDTSQLTFFQEPQTTTVFNLSAGPTWVSGGQTQTFLRHQQPNELTPPINRIRLASYAEN